MIVLFLLYNVFGFAGGVSIGGYPEIRISQNKEWKSMNSIFIKAGSNLDMQCTIKNVSTSANNTLELKKQQFNNSSSLHTIHFVHKMQLLFSIEAHVQDSGIYICYFGGRTAVLSVNVANLVLRRNGTIPSTVIPQEIYSNIYNERVLKPLVNTEEGFMICICELSSSMQLDMISVSWSGFYGSNLEISEKYEEVSWRNETTHVIGTRLALRKQSLDAHLYGKYNCIFELMNTGSVSWDVFLRVPPILRLPIGPPPPPLSATTLNNRICRNQLTDPSAIRLVKQWEGACVVLLAFPPVTEHFWNWSNPQHAIPHILDDSLAPKNGTTIFSRLQEPTGLENCPPLIIRQDVHADLNGPTVFWCQAENEVGASAILWPTPYNSSGFLSRLMWPMIFLTLQIISGIGVVVWECYCRRIRRGVHRTTRKAARSGKLSDGHSLIGGDPEDGTDYLRILHKGRETGNSTELQYSLRSTVSKPLPASAETVKWTLIQARQYSKDEVQEEADVQGHENRIVDEDDPYFWDEGSSIAKNGFRRSLVLPTTCEQNV